MGHSHLSMIATSFGLCNTEEMKALGLLLKLIMFAPICFWIQKILDGSLGADPVKELNHQTGLWGLYYLLINLGIGILIWSHLYFRIPFSNFIRLLQKQRRWLGVIGFLFIIAHLVFYFLLEGLDAMAVEQIFTKNYLTFGLGSFLVLTVLALTSNDFSVKKLGGRKWKWLHRSVFLGYALSTFHFFQIEKADIQWFMILNLPMIFILLVRAILNLQRARSEKLQA